MLTVHCPVPDAPAFSFAITEVDPRHASVMAIGELDVAATGDLVAILTAQQGAGRTSIVLDLSAVTFMDCACLGILVGARRRLTALDGGLLLINVSNPVLRLLRLTRSSELTGITGTRATP